MLKCVLTKFGVYDGKDLSDDFTNTLCGFFANSLKEDCLKYANTCALISGSRSNTKSKVNEDQVR